MMDLSLETPWLSAVKIEPVWPAVHEEYNGPACSPVTMKSEPEYNQGSSEGLKVEIDIKDEHPGVLLVGKIKEEDIEFTARERIKTFPEFGAPTLGDDEIRLKACETEEQRSIGLGEDDNAHCLEGHEAVFYSSSICGMAFTQENDFKDHLRNHRCSICSKMFPTKTRLKQHLHCHRSHYTCSICNRTAPNQYNFRQHVRSHYRLQHGCSICAQSFLSLNCLKDHMRCHMGKEIKCSKCHASFSSISHFESHLKKKGTRQYYCSKCNKCCDDIRLLKEHLVVHDG